MTDKLKAGETLTSVYQFQVDSVKKNPKSVEPRISLFQIFCVRGEWDRAIAQLATLNELTDTLSDFVRTYDLLIRCERFRQMVFSGERQPMLVGEPEPWIAYLFQSLALDANNKQEEAARLRNKAFEQAIPTSFLINGTIRADWLSEADSRFGPMFEACLNGKYYWIPFDRIEKIQIDAPTDLRDLVWTPSTITFASGGEQVAFLPARYLGSELIEDDGIRLGRRTEWTSMIDPYYSGLGQHMWTSGNEDFSILDVRSAQRLVES